MVKLILAQPPHSLAITPFRGGNSAGRRGKGNPSAPHPLGKSCVRKASGSQTQGHDSARGGRQCLQHYRDLLKVFLGANGVLLERGNHFSAPNKPGGARHKYTPGMNSSGVHPCISPLSSSVLARSWQTAPDSPRQPGRAQDLGRAPAPLTLAS